MFKSCGNSIDKIKQQVDEKDTRTKAFLEIFSKVYDDYSAFLDDTGEIDFNDMINEAISHTKDKKYESGFKYVLVDEFQDSARLTEANAKFLIYWL